MIKNEAMKIVSQQEIAASIYELTLSGSLVSEMNQPGQFVHIKTGNGYEPLLRRPISISSIDKENNTFTMVYRAEGKGTSLLSQETSDTEIDVLGPLGNGFTPEVAISGETTLLVGGGIGVPPLYELSKRLTKLGVNVIHVLGFQNAATVFYEEKFRALGETYITTVDGSHGTKGFVTDVIDKLSDSYTTIFACGPTPMLRALESAYKETKEVFLSLEERMGCGIGACFACVCHTAEDPTGFHYKKVCSDGPVFRAGEVVL
ncbi:dihydroorotate dehydrogenase electron transfer subunit [Peribacillus loiseleuriae]|uniref:dihydroorotate dehydrogenase electron transfer subunit n=1 Tax=Peribacillus loiseleuriae TaxID=1679170 RepID=UPI003D094D8C